MALKDLTTVTTSKYLVVFIASLIGGVIFGAYTWTSESIQYDQDSQFIKSELHIIRDAISESNELPIPGQPQNVTVIQNPVNVTLYIPDGSTIINGT